MGAGASSSADSGFSDPRRTPPRETRRVSFSDEEPKAPARSAAPGRPKPVGTASRGKYADAELYTVKQQRPGSSQSRASRRRPDDGPARRDRPPADGPSAELLAEASRACDLATMSVLLRTPQPRAAVAAGLRAAAEEGECEAVELLLGHDARAARVADGAGRTPLHFAALSRKPRARDVATLLVLADPRGGREDQKGDTPAHVASRAGAAGALEALVAGGVDVDAKNRRGETPVMVAAKHGQGAIVAYLRQVVTTRRAETARVVAVWECFFENAARRAVFGDAPTKPKRSAASFGDAPTKPTRSAASTRAVAQARAAPRAAARAWTEAWDPTHERLYYVDDASGESVWERPAGGRVAGDGCGGWRRCWDDGRRAYYYADGRETRWLPPAALEAALARADATECYDVASGRTYRLSASTGVAEWDDDDDDDWVRAVDAATGVAYYKRGVAGEAAWEAPPACGAQGAEWVLVDAEQPYWLHEASGASRWERPHMRCAADDGGRYFLDLASGAASWDPPAEALLAPDWTLCYGDGDARPFFYHDASRRSSWAAPWTSER